MTNKICEKTGKEIHAGYCNICIKITEEKCKKFEPQGCGKMDSAGMECGKSRYKGKIILCPECNKQK